MPVLLNYGIKHPFNWPLTLSRRLRWSFGVSSGVDRISLEVKWPGKAGRGRFFGRRRLQPINATERPHEAEEAPNPMSREGWPTWLELQESLELTKQRD